MPRQQVYGKKSKAVYDPFAVFVSPHRALPNTNVAVDIQNTLGNEPRIQSPSHDTDHERRALGERSANSVVVSRSPQVSTKSKRRNVKKAVERRDVLRKPRLAGRNAHSEPSTEDEHTRSESHSDDKGRPKAEEVLLGTSSVIDQATAELNVRYVSTQENDPPSEAALAPVTTDEWEDISSALQQLRLVPDQQNPYSLHCADILSLADHQITSFSDRSEQLSTHFTITKIAEASFGEVYRLSPVEQIANFSRSDESVFKVIALKPPNSSLPRGKKRRAAALKSAELMSKPEEVANEIKLLQRMSSIPGFTNFRDVRVLQGRPPPAFVKAFAAFNASEKAKQKDGSHFPDPAKKGSYREEQLWAVIEMQDAGTDLERYVESGLCTSMWSVWDIFWQVVLSLAKGEEGAEFEHRDLHLGNICVRQRPTSTKNTRPLSTGALAKIDTKRKLNFTNLETTIIDYTISRARMPDTSTAYHNLAADTFLFEGDSTEEYQYDIYRYMRGAVFLDNALADPSYSAHRHRTSSGLEAGWRDYHPITNLVWLHFVLYKLSEQVEWPSASKAPPKKQKEEHAAWKRANELEQNLLKVQGLLEPEVLGRSGIRAASDLVGLALTEEWLDVEDVVGDDGDDGLGEEESEGVQIMADELVEKLQTLVMVDELAP